MFDPVLFHRINELEITDEDRARAIDSMTTFLKKVDLRAVHELRKKLELPPEMTGFLVELYVAKLGGSRIYRSIIPISTWLSKESGAIVDKELVDGRVPPNTSVSIRVPTKAPFFPERVFVSAAGTDGGAADWIIDDIRVDGKTQYLQEGGLPGDMFATNALAGFVRFHECREHVEVIARYIGSQERGVQLYASIVGDTDLVPSADAA